MDTGYQGYYLIVIGTVGMLLLASAIIIFVIYYQKKMVQEQMRRQAMEVDYQKKMMLAELTSRENERARVSKDLHDGVGVMLQVLRTAALTVAAGASQEDKNEIQNHVDEITETIRRISFDLMPADLQKFGIIKTVEELCNRLNKRGSILISFKQAGTLFSLDQQSELLLYRIIQESVNNALRHARPTEILILFTRTEQEMKVSITDNGIGFDFPTPNKELTQVSGLGLSSIQNRANLLKATLTYEKNSPAGTIVNLILPVI